MRAYVLSLDSDFRNLELRDQLESLGIEVIHVQGPTKSSASAFRKEITGVSKTKLSRMSAGEIACTLGHRLMHEKALVNQDEQALFFEDDAILDFAKFESLMLNIHSIKVALLLLGTCGGWARRRGFKSVEDIGIFRVGTGSQMGSHAYLATDEAIKDLYLHNSQLERLADSFHRSRKLKLYVCSPFVARQLPDALPAITRSGADRKGLMKSPRRIVTSFVEDLLDLYKFGHFGGRTVNLIELQQIVAIFLKKLPGCR